MAGKGKSRLGYVLMKVLIQLVDVKDIYANLNIQTDKRIKGEANVAGTFNMLKKYMPSLFFQVTTPRYCITGPEFPGEGAG